MVGRCRCAALNGARRAVRGLGLYFYSPELNDRKKGETVARLCENCDGSGNFE